MKKLFIFLLILLIPVSVLSSPQKCPGAGDFALNFNFPGVRAIESYDSLIPLYSVGFTFHISDTLFIRPSFIFNKVDDEDSSYQVRTYMGGTLDVLIALSKYNGLTVYFGPGLLFLTDNNGDNDGNGHDIFSFKLKLGAQYNFTKTFAIYADFGAGVMVDNDHNASGTDDKTTNIGLFGAYAGIAMYL